jgi:hypothetical protein
MKRNVFAGMGLGLLIGVIVGLSIAQVTGMVLGALTSLLAGFFGLKGSKEGEMGNQILIGTFSLTCLCAIFFGMFIRTHDLFSPSMTSDVDKYKYAKFSEDEIKKIILFKELGLVPEGYKFSKDAKDTHGLSVLMVGGDSTVFLCQEIDENSPLEEIKSAFDRSGGRYQQVERSLSSTISNPGELRLSLLHIKTLLCK